MSEQQLCLALQDHLDWEPEMVESIVASLKQAAVRNATSEIEDIVQVSVLQRACEHTARAALSSLAAAEWCARGRSKPNAAPSHKDASFALRRTT